MVKTSFILVFVLVFLSATVAFSQGRPEWIGQLETTIRQKEPQWKIGDHLVSNDAPEIYSESFRLTKAGVTGAVSITIYTVLINPIETFHGLVTANDNMMRQRKTVLSGLGDEGFMWAGAGPNDHATVFFRKGKSYISVFLPGKAAARRFAKHVADHMP